MKNINIIDTKLKGTKTEKNLWEAARAEGVAFAKYSAFSREAKREGYEQIAAVFEKTADNERVHAALWMRELGIIRPDTRENLINAAKTEKYEWSEMYERFANVADEEGFADIAEKMRGMARIESAHEQRYREIIADLELMQVFCKPGESVWECRHCGNIYIGECAPEICSVCSHPQGFFEKRNENFR